MKPISKKKISSEISIAIAGVLSKYGKVSNEVIDKSIKKSDKDIAKRFIRIVKKKQVEKVKKVSKSSVAAKKPTAK